VEKEKKKEKKGVIKMMEQWKRWCDETVSDMAWKHVLKRCIGIVEKRGDNDEIWNEEEERK